MLIKKRQYNFRAIAFSGIIIILSLFLAAGLIWRLVLLSGPEANNKKDNNFAQIKKIDNQFNNTQATTTPWQCLKEGEEADFVINKKENQQSTATIIIKNKKTNREIKEFEIGLVSPDHYHPLELKKCGIYTTKSFGYNYKTREAVGDYEFKLWVYDYSGQSKELLLLGRKEGDNYNLIYSSDFRVSPNEKYVALIRSYSTQPDYALVIKDLKTKDDVFTLEMKEVINKYPDIGGDFSLIGWKQAGKYFWADIYTAALTAAYLRINSQDWNWELFPTPPKALGGYEPNYITGWMPYAPAAVWTGMVEMDELVREEARARGQISPLYLCLLYTSPSPRDLSTSRMPSSA